MPTVRARRTGAALGALALTALLVATAAGTAGALPSPSPDQFGGAARHAAQTRISSDLTSSLRDGKVDNVILLIGDGMGDSEITIARDYLVGAGGTLAGIDALPATGQYTTYSLYKDVPYAGKPDYVPDSAATGTAWATGTKTYDNAISVDIHGDPHATLLELAKANGYKTGDVSTAEIQDATPAVQVAHVAQRSCFGPDSASCGPDALVNGGAGSISEQLLDTRPDVTLGGGAATFAQTAKAGDWEGMTLLEQAEERGYQLPTDAASLAAVTVADQDQPVLGLFA
ncbi:alkaline phosphatase, partial [Schumannella luteola]